MQTPPETPFEDPRRAHPPGVSPLDPAAWVVTGPDYAAQMAERTRLIARYPGRVLACLPEAAAAAEELREMLRDHLAERAEFALEAGAIHRPDGVVVPDQADPLRWIGHLVAEDFCLMLPGEPEMRLGGAVLCFPSRWSLAEKIGRPLTEIHDPVPGYAGQLAQRVNRIFAAIRPGQPLVRVNWLLHATAELHLPLEREAKLAKDRAPFRPGQPLYLRTERQTLTRLPRSGAVAFGIRTQITPLARLAGAARLALRRELARLTPEEVAYRSGDALWRTALSELA